jgi:hypothetical protein
VLRFVLKGAKDIMKHSSFLRRAAAALVLVVTVVAFRPAFAQSPAYGSIGLYADESRSTNAGYYSGAPTEITMYVFCNPTARGLYAVEFSIAYPANVLPGDITLNPLVAVELGDLDTGTSVSFTDCQNDWVWTHHRSLFLLNTEETRIEIEENEVAGDYQIATCEIGYPLEPVFISSLLCLNAACPPDTVAPLLAGAAYAGASAVTVTFSEPMLKQTAQNPSSYTITEAVDTSATVPVGEVTLFSDGASATLFTSQPLVAGARYIVRAPGVWDPWGNAVPSWSTAEFSSVDPGPPRVVRASTTVDSLLTIVFSEPVSPATATNPNNYRIYRDGVPVPSYAYRAVVVEQSLVVLSFDNMNLLPSAVTLTVRVTNVTDLDGNVVSPSYNTASFTVPDTSPPYLVAVQALGVRLVQVRFSEEVLEATAEVPGNYQISRVDTTLTVPVIAAVLQPDKRFVQLALGADLTFDVEHLLQADNIQDIHGNTLSGVTSMVFVLHDTYPPVPLSAAPLSRTLVRVAFNEQLEETSAETKTNYAMCETSQSYVCLSISGAELETGADAVRLSLGSEMKIGVGYTIRVQNVKDLKGNAVTYATVTTVYPDTFPPVMTGVTTTSATTIELAFDEAITRSSAEDESNYLLFETADPSHEIGIAAAALRSDSSRVGLVLAADLVAGTSYTISMSNLMDRAGNVIAAGTSLAFTSADATPPALLSAYASVNTAVLARFSEKLDDVTAQSPANYLVYETANPGATVAVSSAALQSDSSYVLLTLGGTLQASTAYSLSATGVADRAGNPVPPGSVVSIGRPDTTPPHVSGAQAATLSYVQVVFDEPVAPATAVVTTNYTITPVSFTGPAIQPVSVDQPTGNTAGLHLGADLATNATFKVSVSNVTDLAGNAIAPGSETNFSTSDAPPDETGFIGLYTDEFHSSNTVNAATPYTQFPLYVWCLPGEDGMQAAEFSVAYPTNAVPLTTLFHPAIVITLGTITTDLSVVFGEGACCTGWTWIVKQDCLLLNLNPSVIAINPGVLIASCATGFPIEDGTIISDLCIGCAPPVATLLQESAARFDDGAMEVTWRLSRMDDGTRFGVSRREEGKSEYGASSSDVEADGLSFSYRDESVEPGKTYRYRVEYADGSGSHVLFETDPVVVPALPLALEQNWPNPFNPSTTILYYLPQSGHVRLEIFDVAGRRVACLVDRNEEHGNRTVVWNGSSESGQPAATGIYIYRLTAGRETLSRKMVLIR